ncbi:UdgX family uracil-DNA binding protein [Neorhodopirellula pilleata]|uniref:Type-4 uracil-DNA glycosylase n=1 Tax=Neorhodopirellula pilleata TaxID=2714738 RepID=A0A5C6AQ94_9BACT|nr:UdgX family uracil-DNA binding protein [Neorhodopirellula pilleata]TWU01718.1 Uracil DNA glycosylase superfamily protein [Neorhodopirellula pilleata]
MTRFLEVETFEQWRAESRRLLEANVAPDDVVFSADESQPLLFAQEQSRDGSQYEVRRYDVPNRFMEMATHVACHRDPQRWELLYRTLWRLTHGEHHLMNIETDDDVYQLSRMQRAVSRDVHKMKAFVRFRKVSHGDEREEFVAWHRPDHRILRLAAPFFSRRFKAMSWSILTPDESVTWDQSELHYGPGLPVTEAPDGDALEELWKTYYASIFNPARVKVAMMKREMPVRYWATMPETELIDDLLAQAPSRVDAMIANREGFADTATKFISTQRDLPSLRMASAACQACELHQHATQTVFGEGPLDAKLVIVGEQPGDCEDIEGHPFVGPAGKLLQEAMTDAGIERKDVYLTNAVKHFKFVENGGRRLHKKPSSREIFACRPWLEAELAAIRPETVVCLGATAAQSLIGRDFRITASRGKIQTTEWCDRTIATWHPSAILRAIDETRRSEMKQQLVHDLRIAAG